MASKLVVSQLVCVYQIGLLQVTVYRLEYDGITIVKAWG
jgi:hypothetical protein